MEKTITERWYAMPAEEVLNKLGVNPEEGLSTAEVEARQAQYGKNELPAKEGSTIFQMILEQFQDVTVILLIIAAVISFFLDEAEDSIVILVIVILNAIIGVYQERQAENALAALSKLQTPLVRTRRNGHIAEVSAVELVPGDIVLLEAGNRIPADGRLFEAVNVKVDESAMTGESHAVDKEVRVLENSDPPPPLADRINTVYMGTAMTYGRAEMVVTETGLKTQLGNIAALLQNVEKGRTPLQERLEKMGFVLAGGALAVCAIVFVAGVLRGEPIEEMFLTSVSLAVAAVPEGLPAVITVSLALGANRMIKRHALIRKLPAVETLGSVTTICSDKTGTLTRNEMTVTTVVLPGHEDIRVTGVGYEPVGEFFLDETDNTLHVEKNDQLARMVKAAALCTDAYLDRAGEDAPWGVVGDTTEGALLVMAMKQGWSRQALEKDLPREGEIPFTAERKAMTTIHRAVAPEASHLFGHANFVAFVKGAPDQLLEWTSHEAIAHEVVPLTAERRAFWRAEIEALASRGIRVLGLAYRGFDEMPTNPTPETVERNLVFLGLVGIVDPPRAEATKAVGVAQHAGIRPIMITGDHKLTAQAIAQQIGIMHDGTGHVLTGTELDRLSAEELREEVKTVSVFARVSPEHKLRIVEALQKNGEIVAMTGDGVNDAPALKQANIGVAMGITGTDVSKGASDMVLTDDNFASIVAAVEEGRTIYDNIRKFIRYLMGSNSGEIIAMFGAIIVGLKLPLIATQILWINLVTDGLPAIALGFERGEPGVMRRKPRPPKESIFARGLGAHVLWVGVWVGITTLFGFYYVLSQHGADAFDPSEERLLLGRSMAFFTLGMAQVFHVMAIHAGHASFLAAPIWRNRLLAIAVILTTLLQFAAIYIPFAQDVLDTTALDLEHLLIGLLLAASLWPAIEVEKAYWRRRDTEYLVEDE